MKLYRWNFFIIVVIICTTQMGLAQNIVPNGSFENYSSIPSGTGEWFGCNNWTNVNLWPTVQYPYASPDYLHSLGSGSAQLPNSIFGTVSPFSGDALMGLVTKTTTVPDFREYLSVQFSSPMIIGQTYQVTFSITNGSSNQYSGYSGDRFGIRFSTLPLTQLTHEVISLTPQIEILGQFWNTSWQTFSFNFLADSAYSQLTFGNFYDDASTTLVMQVNSNESAYLFIDSVSVIPNSIQIIGDSTICLGDSIKLQAINSSLFSWVNDLNPNIILSTDSILTVSPTSTTSYTVYNNTDSASFTVNVNPNPNPTPTIDLGNDTTLCQGDSLILDATTLNAMYLWQDSSTTPTFNVSQQGVYRAEITVNNCTAADSIMVHYDSIPTLNLGIDTTLCQGELFTIDATTLNASYQWQDNSTNPTLSINQQGIYWVEIAVNSCTTLDSIIINYNPIPTFELGNDTTLCQGDSLILDATTLNAMYLWQDSSTTPTFNVSQQGVYRVEITVNNCEAVDSVIVNYNPIPILNLGSDTTLCQGELFTIDATTLNAMYLWQDNSTNPSLSINQQGIYWAEITVNNCTTLDSITVNYNPIPTFELGNDTTLCQGESFTLNATTLNATYLWQDNSTNPTLNISQQGVYWAEIAVNNCTTEDSIVVSYNPIPTLNLGSDTTLCQGELFTIDATTLNASYLWQDNSTNPIQSINQQGIYWAEITVNNCTARDSISIKYSQLPTLNLGNDITVCQGKPFILDATTLNVSYLWQDNSTNATFEVIETGAYWVEVTNGCASEIYKMEVIFEDCNCYVYIPNTFTPNDNGRNDTFYPQFDCKFGSYELIMFNRWGEIVYHSYDPFSRWDGLYNGVLAPTGVYTYKLNYNTSKGYDRSNKQVIGHVTLLR